MGRSAVQRFRRAPVIGIVGTFLALAVRSAKQGVFLPWLPPAYTFPLPYRTSIVVAGFGYLGGLVLIPVMTGHLAWHEPAS